MAAKGTRTLPGNLCECGCGKPAPLANRTSTRDGYVKGQPVRFIQGHQNWKAERYVVDSETGCWLWTLAINSAGYGQFTLDNQRHYAHRWHYEQAKGPIPEGLQLDHLCRTPRCVNPDHLEPVTPAENSRRGLRAKLTVAAVREIRASSERDGVLASRFGVSKCNVNNIRAGRAWVGV